MNRMPRVAACAAIAAIILLFGVSRLKAQAQKPAPAPTAQAPDDEEASPFPPEPPSVLPPGMTGADVNDPRAKLAPGLYDAGEASEGLKHLMLFKKPDAFQLGATDPDDPKVEQTISRLNIR